MKIVYTTHQFLPEYSAGTETLTYGTAKEMSRRGHDVRIFTGYRVKGSVDASHAFDRYDYDGIPVDRFFHSNTTSIRPRNPMEAEYNNLFYADFFRTRIQEIKPDLVHFYHLQRLSASVIDVCREMTIPTLMTATDFWLICPTNQLLLPDYSGCPGPDSDTVNCIRHLAAISQGKNIRSMLDLIPDWLMAMGIGWIKRTTIGSDNGFIPLARAMAFRSACMEKRMNHIDTVLVATRFMAEMLQRHGLESGRIRHLIFGIDQSVIKSVSEKGVEKNLRVGFMGTLYHHKGAHVLLEAVRALPMETALKVKVYGSLEQFPEYARRLRAIAGNDPRIEFCGTFPHPEIGAILSGLDVLVIPSLWYENSPLTLLFAQAAGVPVVATDSEGLKESIVHGENGLLFEKGDAKGLAEIIRTLCMDRAMVKNMSGHARPPRSISDYVNELEQIYTKVLRGRAA